MGSTGPSDSIRSWSTLSGVRGMRSLSSGPWLRPVRAARMPLNRGLPLILSSLLIWLGPVLAKSSWPEERFVPVSSKRWISVFEIASDAGSALPGLEFQRVHHCPQHWAECTKEIVYQRGGSSEQRWICSLQNSRHCCCHSGTLLGGRSDLCGIKGRHCSCNSCLSKLAQVLSIDIAEFFLIVDGRGLDKALGARREVQFPLRLKMSFSAGWDQPKRQR